jgi:photosystem II stability/assembly factor-like uncharacterized protein
MARKVTSKWFCLLLLATLVGCGSSSSNEGPGNDPGANNGRDTNNGSETDNGGDDGTGGNDDDSTDQGGGDDASDDLHWSWAHPSPQGYGLNAVLSDGERLFAVGDMGAILTSSNGTDWQVQHNDGGVNLYAIAHNGEAYVAVGARETHSAVGLILYSEDGDTWQRASLDEPAEALHAVAWTHDSFVAMGEASEQLLRSDDGISWSHEDTNLSVSGVTGLAADGETLVASSFSQIDTSYDGGVDWSGRNRLATSGQGREVNNARFDGEHFLVVGGYNVYGLQRSSDGDSWAGIANFMDMYNASPRKSYTDVVTAEGYYWLTEASGRIDKRAVDASGVSAVVETRRHDSLLGIGYLDGHWAAVGERGRILHSDDGDDWQSVRSVEDPLDDFIGLAVNKDGRLLALRERSGFTYSDDGQSWQDIDLPEWAEDIHALTSSLDGETFIAVGRDVLAVSPDGEDWTLNTDFSHNFTLVAAGEDSWLAAHYLQASGYHRVVRCTEITACEQVDSPGFPSALTWHDGQFILAERRDNPPEPWIHRSPDGEDWGMINGLALDSVSPINRITHMAGNSEALVLMRQLSPTNPRGVDFSVSFNGGENWQALVLDEALERDTATVLSVDDTLLIADHQNNLLWYSTDGQDWSSMHSAHRLEAIVERDGQWFGLTPNGILARD